MRRLSGWAILLASFLIYVAPAGAAVRAGAPSRKAPVWGAGIVIGDPTGLTLKRRLDDGEAVDASLAWDLSGADDRFEVHGDWLDHMPLAVPRLPGRLSWYAGVGARLLAGDKTRLGARLPLGVSLELPQRRLELFAELAPIVDFVPDTDATASAGIGARYYFR